MAPLAPIIVSLTLASPPLVSGSDATGWSLQAGDRGGIFEQWRPETRAVGGDGLRVAASAVAVQGGLDVTWTIENPTREPQPLRRLHLPRCVLGSDIACMDFYRSGWPQKLSQEGQHRRMQGTWPGTLYSPVAVIMNTTTAIGVSLQYPVLEYRHACSIAVQASGEGAWDIEIQFGGSLPEGDFPLPEHAMVPAGAERTYTVSVRATGDPRSWITTLEPYRSWFHQRYGGVQYVRSGAPIRGVILAFSHYQGADNPAGWSPRVGRPDLDGYQVVMPVLDEALSQASRAILWTPTGRAFRNPSLNLPFRFTSHWNSGAMVNAAACLKRVRTHADRRWGLWWGHALRTTKAWDTLPVKPFDLEDPDQRQLAMTELSGALQAGATIIGLDEFTFGAVPEWQRVAWLEQMQQAAPGVTFCSEGRCSDVLHRLAPTWMDLYRHGPDRFGNTAMVRGRFLLADWLLPGHETWVGMLFDRSADPSVKAGHPSAAVTRRALVDRVVGFGYVPVVFGEMDLRTLSAEAAGDGDPSADHRLVNEKKERHEVLLLLE
ncbi:MAG: hypothetical protein QF561_02240 [Phycisphaerales bacterium]|jgi:hypothetical protein|nr:hypothetical protein [Phycisphaerales bacterium]